jgi:CheY-like chemotaxis protein
MQLARTTTAKTGRVRFLFDDAVVSLSLAADATFEDIARTLDELARRHHGKPVAIDVTLAVPSPSVPRESRGRSSLSWLPFGVCRSGEASEIDRASSARPILVVDDDPDVRDVAVGVLKDAGFSVLAAPSAMEAFRLLEEHRDIALMFTDVVMPGLDGLMLADMAVLRYNDLKVVYATGYANRVGRQPGYRYGPVLPKPYRAADLVRLIERELTRPVTPRYVSPR